MAEEPSPAHRARAVSTMTAAGFLWQAWCETDGCAWKGPVRRGAFGARETAEADAAEHVADAAP